MGGRHPCKPSFQAACCPARNPGGSWPLCPRQPGPGSGESHTAVFSVAAERGIVVPAPESGRGSRCSFILEKPSSGGASQLRHPGENPEPLTALLFTAAIRHRPVLGLGLNVDRSATEQTSSGHRFFATHASAALSFGTWQRTDSPRVPDGSAFQVPYVFSYQPLTANTIQHGDHRHR